MSDSSQATLMNECHSLQSTKKRGTAKRIPRPPNAFMLYRSDLLKRRVIPPEVEKRQQNLSRIAGQSWNTLPEAEKAIWFGKAAAIRAEHYATHYFYSTGLLHKETKRPSVEGERRGHATHSSRRVRTRQTRMPYCDSMFAALHGAKFCSLGSEASISPTPVSKLSPSTSLSPLTSPHLLSPFTPDTYIDGQDSPSTASYNSPSGKGEFSYTLDLPSREKLHTLLPQIAPHEIGSFREPYPALQQHEDDFALFAPFPGLVQPSERHSDIAAQIPLPLPRPSACPPVGYDSVENSSLLNDFDVTNIRSHFNQSLISLYHWNNEEQNISK